MADQVHQAINGEGQSVDHKSLRTVTGVAEKERRWRTYRLAETKGQGS